MLKSIEIFIGYWSVDDVRNNRHKLFVYGDNNFKIGKGGQAIIRDEGNTIGIPTKKIPNDDSKSFYTDNEFDDNEFDDNKYKIDCAINKLLKKFMKDQYKILVFPENGLGTGLSKLEEKAPKTFEYLENKIDTLKILFS